VPEVRRFENGRDPRPRVGQAPRLPEARHVQPPPWQVPQGWFRMRIEASMPQLVRITRDPSVMGGKPCIRGMRVTVGTIVGLVAAGHSTADILREYPYLQADDVSEALSYAAWRAQEVEVPLSRRPR
jgi:uncharacterized protein (DUF433 family)